MFLVIACIFGLIGVCMKYKRQTRQMNSMNELLRQSGSTYSVDIDGEKVDNKTGITYKTLPDSTYGTVSYDVRTGQIFRYDTLEYDKEFEKCGIRIAMENGRRFAIVQRDMRLVGTRNLQPTDNWGNSWDIKGHRYINLNNNEIYVLRRINNFYLFFINIKTRDVVFDSDMSSPSLIDDSIRWMYDDAYSYACCFAQDSFVFNTLYDEGNSQYYYEVTAMVRKEQEGRAKDDWKSIS